MVVAADRDELIEHLRTQVGFLRKSGREFDEGDESEAVRLAVTIRVLVHNSKSSTSLLKQLGVQHQLKFLDTALIPMKPTTPGALMKVFSAGLGVIRMGPRPSFVAPLGDKAEENGEPRDDIFGPQPFRSWWNRPVLEDLRNERFTRKELVLFLAHKFGGAHVDPNMEPRFIAITRFNSLGWGWQREGDQISLVVPAGPESEPMGTPIPVNVRQIAYELETSLTGQLSDLLGLPTEVPPSLTPSSQP